MESIQIGIWTLDIGVQVSELHEYAAHITLVDVKAGVYPILLKVGKHGRRYICIDVSGTVALGSVPRVPGTEHRPYISPYLYQIEAGERVHGGVLKLFDLTPESQVGLEQYRKYGV